MEVKEQCAVRKSRRVPRSLHGMNAGRWKWLVYGPWMLGSWIIPFTLKTEPRKFHGPIVFYFGLFRNFCHIWAFIIKKWYILNNDTF